MPARRTVRRRVRRSAVSQPGAFSPTGRSRPTDRRPETDADDSVGAIAIAPTDIAAAISAALAGAAGIRADGAVSVRVQAINLATRRKPDVAVIDITFDGEIRGIMMARHIQRWVPSIGIVMVSGQFEPESVRSAALLFGTTWSYVHLARIDNNETLGEAVRSASRSIQWVDPVLRPALEATCEIARQSREMEERPRSPEDPPDLRSEF